MKKLLKLFVLINSIINYSYAQTDVLKDERDGKEYKIVQIGSQTWMAENLKYADTIARLYSPHIHEHKTRISMIGPKDFETQPSDNIATIYCYLDNPVFCYKYGMLYTWTAAQNACPIGWHLPSKQEFEILLKVVGGGDKEKAKQALLFGGSSGFEALSGGLLFSGYDGNNNQVCSYIDIKTCGYFWSSSTKSKKKAKALIIAESKGLIGSDLKVINNLKEFALSVRCIKDSIH